MDEQEHELILPPISDQDNICLPLSVNAVSKYWNVERRQRQESTGWPSME